MKTRELQDQLRMSYEGQVEYLLNKYGIRRGLTMELRTKWTSEGGNAPKKCGQAFVKNGQTSRELSLKWTNQSGKWTNQSGNYGGRECKREYQKTLYEPISDNMKDYIAILIYLTVFVKTNRPDCLSVLNEKNLTTDSHGEVVEELSRWLYSPSS